MRQLIQKHIQLTVLIVSWGVSSAGAQNTPVGNESLSALIQLGLGKSAAGIAARSDVRLNEATETATGRGQYVPQISLGASYQQFKYDRLKDDGTGKLISNDGQNTSLSLTLSYDLQKLFGSESELARQAADSSHLQEKLTSRDIIRNVKKSYATIKETRAEIAEYEKLISQFTKADAVLAKQKKMGVYNELERQQFHAQQSAFYSELQTRKADLEAAYFQLATLTDTDVEQIKIYFDKAPVKTEMVFAGKSEQQLEKVNTLQDEEVLQNLSKEYDASKLEYDKTTGWALPTVYVKGMRDNPTMPSSDGPQTVAEVGVTFPLEGFFTRSSQNSVLGAKAERARALYEKSVSEYRNQIKLNILNLRRYTSLEVPLEQTRTETEKLLDKSFLYYSQKRIDVLGTIDIFQKYLQAVKNCLTNQMQIEWTDAELEYLVGGVKI